MAFSAKDLHPRHKIFADEWLTGENTGKRMNGRAAYEYAGYHPSEKNPSANASKLLRHPKVADYIRSRLDEYGMGSNEAMMRFAAIARSEMGDIVIVDPSNPERLKLDVQKVVEHRGLIKSFGFDSNGNPKIEFQDSMRALENVARVNGMFKDGLEISGVGGGPVQHMKVEFIGEDGEGLDLGEDLNETEEDFEEFDKMDEVLDQLD